VVKSILVIIIIAIIHLGSRFFSFVNTLETRANLEIHFLYLFFDGEEDR
jgi:hypothetical protein